MTKKFKLNWKDMTSPCVYVLMNGNIVLYVGSSKNGFERFLSPVHHKIKDIRKWVTDVRVCVFGNMADALWHEAKLIEKLKPALNSGNKIRRASEEYSLYGAWPAEPGVWIILDDDKEESLVKI